MQGARARGSDSATSRTSGCLWSWSPGRKRSWPDAVVGFAHPITENLGYELSPLASLKRLEVIKNLSRFLRVISVWARPFVATMTLLSRGMSWKSNSLG
jgi:hypothetical protein